MAQKLYIIYHEFLNLYFNFYSFGSSDCFLKKFESLSTKTLNQLWPYLLQALSRPRSSISAQVTTCNMEEFPLSDILPTGISLTFLCNYFSSKLI